ncbi:MAG: hypothetical protein KGI73_04090 [Patescibacteria group bacterium]|nr:hypothetical protein [Patescibacteria group bacterium]
MGKKEQQPEQVPMDANWDDVQEAITNPRVPDAVVDEVVAGAVRRERIKNKNAKKGA